MNRPFAIAAASIFLMSCAVVSYPASALEKPNIMVMGESADRDSVPRNSRIFRRVLDALQSLLQNRGYAVYLETATSGATSAQNWRRRSDVEVVDVARGIEAPPIDVAVIFQVHASAEQLSYTTKPHVRVAGRLVNIHSARFLDSFEVDSFSEDRLPYDCDRECLLEGVGKSAKHLARDLGDVLSRKLDRAWKGPTSEAVVHTNATDNAHEGVPNAFTLNFENFCGQEDANDIENYLVAFTGYVHHRPVRETNCLHAYWYETSAEPARLVRNVRRMLDFLNTTARVSFSGNTITAERY